MKKILCCFVVLCFTFMFCSSCSKKGENSPANSLINSKAAVSKQSFFRLGNPCIYIPTTIFAVYALAVTIASFKDGSFKWKVFF
jgi:hypothetical protein